MYLIQVPPLWQGRCWQTGGSQSLIFLPLTASPIRSLSFELTQSFPMQPTNLLDPAPALSGVSHWGETSPRNMGPNVPCGEKTVFSDSESFVLVTRKRSTKNWYMGFLWRARSFETTQSIHNSSSVFFFFREDYSADHYESTIYEHLSERHDHNGL